MNKMNKYRPTITILSLLVIFGFASRKFLFQNIMEGLTGSESLTEAQEKARAENAKQAANITIITDTLHAITSDYNIEGVSGNDNGLLADLKDIQDWNEGTLPYDTKYGLAVSNIRLKLQTLYGALQDHETSTLETSSMLTTALQNIQGLEEVSSDLISSETNNLKQQEINKKRLIQNNDYYVNRYVALTNIVKMLILFSIIMIALMYLANKDFLPGFITEIGIPFFFALMIFYIIYLYVDIKRRNPLNYDEYDLTFVKPSEEKI
jgi:hypothetical protein